MQNSTFISQRSRSSDYVQNLKVVITKNLWHRKFSKFWCRSLLGHSKHQWNKIVKKWRNDVRKSDVYMSKFVRGLHRDLQATVLIRVGWNLAWRFVRITGRMCQFFEGVGQKIKATDTKTVKMTNRRWLVRFGANLKRRVDIMMERKC